MSTDSEKQQGGRRMKNCSWCLWLGDKKIFNIRQLRESFDTDILVGYCKGGVLERWLYDAGEGAVLEKLKKLDEKGDIGAQLEFIFGVRPDPKPEKTEIKPREYPELPESVRLALMAVSGEYNGAASSYNSSFKPTSFRSIREWELEKGSYVKGSFAKGAFLNGSFRGISGSFSKGSFRGGSFWTGSFRLVKTSFSGSSFSVGSFRPTSGGSFRYFMGNAELTAEEYRRTRINLSSCPLNEHGYGIHRI